MVDTSKRSATAGYCGSCKCRDGFDVRDAEDLGPARPHWGSRELGNNLTRDADMIASLQCGSLGGVANKLVRITA